MDPTRQPAPPPGEVTSLLQAWGQGDATARDRLMPLVDQELRRRAAGQLRRARCGHTLRPTDLVHETVAAAVEPTCWTSTPRSKSCPRWTSGRRAWSSFDSSGV